MFQNLTSNIGELQQLMNVELSLVKRDRAETLALLETMQSEASFGFGFVDRKFRYVRVNETLALLNGLSVAEHLGQPVADVVPDLWRLLSPVYRKVLASGQAVCDLELDGITAADRSRSQHWLLSFYPVCVEGEVIGICILVVDITERTDAEDARRLARIVEDSDEAIFTATTDGIALSWNAGAERLFGYTAQEIIGHPVAVLAPAGLAGEQQQQRARMNAGGSLERRETTRQRKDGSMVDVIVIASPSTDHTGAVVGASVIMQDITRRCQWR